jgi:dihydroorotase
MRILIKGGHVVDPANDIDKVQDIYIADGKILSRGRKPQDFHADRVIDAAGLVVCPGLVDLRARLREPGQENKATIASETKAAAKGGVTTLCCPPDTDPVIDTPAVVELIHRRALEAGFANVVPLGALTYRLRGEKLAEMSALKRAGCVGVSNALQPVDPKILRRAMEYAASQGLTVYLHPEDSALSQNGCAHEGVVSVRLGLPGVPETAETVAVAQALQLIDLTGVHAHFCQLSSAAAARMIARAQYDGAPITADVTAHQLFLTEMDIGFFNAQCHVRPPLRTQRDRDGLREALVNGTISAISSDHQPHDTDAKLAPFPATEPGISAIETLLPLTLRLVDEGLLTLSDAISRVTFFPANILDINAGTLDNGASADICIFHPHYSWRYDEQHIVSAGKNTPFLGWHLKGFVTHTLLDGNIVHEVDAATLQEVMERGAYEAEQAQATTHGVSAAIETDDSDLADDDDAYLMDDAGDEQEWLEEPPLVTDNAPATPPPDTRHEASQKPKPRDKKKADKTFPDAPLESSLSGNAVPEKPLDEPLADKSPTTETDAYRPAFSSFTVPHKKFAPLSDQVLKNQTDSALTDDKTEPVNSATQTGKDDD